MLIMVCGLPGTGKSSFSKELAKKIGADYLSSDSIRMQVLDRRTYSKDEKSRIYRLLAEKAGRSLTEGKSVIVDATFYLRDYRELFCSVAENNGTSLEIIECVLDEKELRGRIEKRKGEKSESEADFEVYLKIKGIFEPIEREHLILDMALPLDEQIKRVLKYIG